ncbi:MAG: hypothetical protein HXY40_09300 [Chloroflexi bacterium]|nr:hypothetical protein [Chloroflexota bacterium]
MKQQPQQAGRPSTTTLIIGVVVVLVVLFIGSRLLGGGAADAAPTNTPPPTAEAQTEQDNSDDRLNLGAVVVAENVNRDGCAVDVTDRFDDDATIYAVLQDSAMPEGTVIFARLYRDDVAVEDSDELTAPQDYTNVCVNFAFDSADGWQSGSYEVEFFVNGNPYQSATFSVR